MRRDGMRHGLADRGAARRGRATCTAPLERLRIGSTTIVRCHATGNASVAPVSATASVSTPDRLQPLYRHRWYLRRPLQLGSDRTARHPPCSNKQCRRASSSNSIHTARSHRRALGDHNRVCSRPRSSKAVERLGPAASSAVAVAAAATASCGGRCCCKSILGGADIELRMTSICS